MENQTKAAGLWFDDKGVMHPVGNVTLPDVTAALLRQLKLFLMRIQSCQRAKTGAYQLDDTNAGHMGGAEVLWHRVTMLTSFARFMLLAPQLPPIGAPGRRSSSLMKVEVTTNQKPLDDALRQVLFALPIKDRQCPPPIVKRLRALWCELREHHKRHLPVVEIPEVRSSNEDGANDDGCLPKVSMEQLSVFWCGKPAKFTTRSELLLRLANEIFRRPGWTVTYTWLGDAVWEKRTVAPSTVRGAVTRLKQMLKSKRMALLASCIKTGTRGRDKVVWFDSDRLGPNSN